MQETNVDHSTLPMLHPARQNGALWFRHHPQISTGVKKVIKSCFRSLRYSWKKVSYHDKLTFFILFKKRFKWDPGIHSEVVREFKKCAAYRLKAMVSLVKKEGVKPNWMTGDWTVMQAYWTTPKAKANSEKSRASRMFDRNGLGSLFHRAGPQSFVKVQDILLQEASNEDSSFIAVMKKTHQKADGTYADQQARLVAEAYEKRVQERLAQLEDAGEENAIVETLHQREKNEIYVKAATGMSKKGKYGLGSLGDQVLLDVDASSSAVPSEESEILTKKLQEMETALKQSREENLDFQKRLEAMERIVETLGSRIV